MQHAGVSMSLTRSAVPPPETTAFHSFGVAVRSWKTYNNSACRTGLPTAGTGPRLPFSPPDNEPPK